MNTADFELEEVHLVHRFMREISPKNRADGEKLSAKRAVTAIEVVRPGMEYTAKVADLPVRDTRVQLEVGRGWVSRCTCNQGWGCPHAFALMKDLLARHSGALIERLSSGGSSPVRKSDVKETKGLLAAISVMAEEKLKRKLKPPERKLYQGIERLWRNFQAWGTINQHELVTTFELDVPATGWKPLASEARPTTPMEFVEWLYMFHERNGLVVPAAMEAVVDVASLKAKVAKQIREAQVRFWEQRFKEQAFDDEEDSVDSGAADVEMRLRITDEGGQIEWKMGADGEFSKIKINQFREFSRNQMHRVSHPSALIWSRIEERMEEGRGLHLGFDDSSSAEVIGWMIRHPALTGLIVNEDGNPMQRPPEPYRWHLKGGGEDGSDYVMNLETADGTPVRNVKCVFQGKPTLYLTPDAIYSGPPILPGALDPNRPVRVPREAVETENGARFLHRMQVAMPTALKERVRTVKLQLRLRAELDGEWLGGDREVCRMEFHLWDPETGTVHSTWQAFGWQDRAQSSSRNSGVIQIFDRSAAPAPAAMVNAVGAKWEYSQNCWHLRVTKQFPEIFVPWIKSLPSEVKVELRGELASLLMSAVAGEVRLDVEEAGIDWFDLKVLVNVSDAELTEDEVKLLLDAKGKWVRLGTKGWKRLEFKFSEEDEEQLAKLGLTARELSSEPQRLHTLQLADAAARRFMPEEKFEAVKRRAAELQTRVAPPVPASIRAELRPYQLEGFHFLAYLATNRFGGILADDMGLGKTVQTLTWLAWLRETAQQASTAAAPCLVVCPKSVTDNWRAEAEKFLPGLRVRVWRPQDVKSIGALSDQADLHVMNYAQLRNSAEEIAKVDFLSVILDEGQYIKNPSSQTAIVARTLRAQHRLILSGTPIENQLMDLWSLMSYSMPGVLGNRAEFSRLFDSKNDPLARRRLSARVRPFLLRRTKTQVAKDLPDRIEEDLFCELEGEQLALYKAEFKRAQAMLLKLQSAAQLNKQRFHVLTSLLRLRQICCDHRLIRPESKTVGAKVEALLDQLDTLVTEGEKVLVFSQFTEMLGLLQEAVKERGWKSFYLAGETENRGDLVREFQSHEGGAVFLISLKAGGFGLNLTAASYVVLFDPWWNPAVENQAIDRTHRIGQARKVIAYRLLIKDSIEEKIRQLQKSKKALAEDVLGEEKFSQGLTLDDLRYLFTDPVQ